MGKLETQKEEASILFHCTGGKHRFRAVAELAAQMFKSLKYSATVLHLTKHECLCQECQKGPSVSLVREIAQRFVQVSNSFRIPDPAFKFIKRRN